MQTTHFPLEEIIYAEDIFFLISSYLVYLTMIQICCGQRHWKADFDLHVGLGCGRNSTEFFFCSFRRQRALQSADFPECCIMITVAVEGNKIKLLC